MIAHTKVSVVCMYVLYQIPGKYCIRYPGNITRWIQRTTRPSDSWQRGIQLIIFPGICAIIYMYYNNIFTIVYIFISNYMYIAYNFDL